MKIDQDSGVVQITPNVIVSPDTTKSEFLSVVINERSEPFVINEPWASYRIDTPDDWIVIVFFREEKLKKLVVERMLSTAMKSQGRDDVAVAMENKRLHDFWLIQNLGNPPYHYRWGDVLSEYSKRDNGSSIFVVYR